MFEKSSNIKFYENPSIWGRVVPCRRTDMTQLIVTFRSFANAPVKVTNHLPRLMLRVKLYVIPVT
jgi:hypothetical protein